MDSEGLAPGERAAAMRQAMQAIETTVRAEPATLNRFEPVVAADGRIQSLRFVFPPFALGRFVDSEHTAEVPAATVLPHVAPPYRALFVGG